VGALVKEVVAQDLVEVFCKHLESVIKFCLGSIGSSVLVDKGNEEFLHFLWVD